GTAVGPRRDRRRRDQRRNLGRRVGRVDPGARRHPGRGADRTRPRGAQRRRHRDRRSLGRAGGRAPARHPGTVDREPGRPAALPERPRGRRRPAQLFLSTKVTLRVTRYSVILPWLTVTCWSWIHAPATSSSESAARAIPWTTASSKLLLLVALTSMTFATDMATSFSVREPVF